MSSQHAFDEDRLRQLVNDRCNGALDPDGFIELYALLSGSNEARQAYWEMLAVHVDLYWSVAGKANPTPQGDGAALFPIDDRGAESAPPHRGVVWLAVAASLMAAVIGGTWFWRPTADSQVAETPIAAPQPERERLETPPPANPVYVANATPGDPGSRWVTGRPGDQNPSKVRLGETLSVEQGTLKLAFTAGATGVVRAPAVLQLEAADRVRLLRGRIKVDAPDQANGFTVETALAEIVDLGTVFSVEADEQGTDLVVFGGKVDLGIPGNTGAGELKGRAKKMQFTTGEAVHIDGDGAVSRIMSVQSTPDSELSKQRERQGTIASVSDNNRRGDYWAFYEIVLGAMGEDARAYADRFHEWNGVEPSGMPAYLVGGDYVKMLNEDKAIAELEIDVVVARPCVLYVLLDERVAAPDWLAAGFENTGDLIGVDESPHDTANRFPANKDFAQVGPGESIDRTHSIWKRTILAPSRVTLGPNGQRHSGSGGDTRPHYIRANMYGIVAVPLLAPE